MLAEGPTDVEQRYGWHCDSGPPGAAKRARRRSPAPVQPRVRHDFQGLRTGQPAGRQKRKNVVDAAEVADLAHALSIQPGVVERYSGRRTTPRRCPAVSGRTHASDAGLTSDGHHDRGDVQREVDIVVGIQMRERDAAFSGRGNLSARLIGEMWRTLQDRGISPCRKLRRMKWPFTQNRPARRIASVSGRPSVRLKCRPMRDSSPAPEPTHTLPRSPPY